MRRLAAYAIRVASPLLGVAAVALGQTTDSVRVARWHADLTFFATELPRRHIKPWAHQSETEFAREVARLDADLPRLTDADIQLRIVRLAAMLSDGHTTVALPVFPTRLPLAVYWFETGPFIVNASADQASIIGARIVSVNGLPMAAVRDTLLQYFSHENELGERNGLPGLFVRPGLLRSVGLAKDTSAIELEVESNAGARRRVTVPAVPAASFMPARSADSLPLYRQRPRDKYWFAYLADTRTVFVKYNQCVDAPDFQRMTDSVTSLLDSVKALRVVVDIRNNGGGNSQVVEPLIAALRKRDRINRKDALFVVTGRQTFSSGLLAAWQFRHDTHATLLGEPPGERTNNYGEVKFFALPNSQLRVSYSTKHFSLGGTSDLFVPDVAVPPTIQAYLANRDDALDWILRDVKK